jgi:hypothetical protein
MVALSLAISRVSTLLLASLVTYSDGKVANREIRVWHLVIENGY